MLTDDILLRNCIILDACCIINLFASGQMGNVLGSIPMDVSVAAYVKDYEALRIYSGPIKNVWESTERIDLQLFINDGLLFVVDIENEEEANIYINLATTLHDGEAITGAIALNRNWALATDDLATVKLFESETLKGTIISTLDLVKYWVDNSKPDKKTIREALNNIRMRGRYEPPRTHPLLGWWRKYRDN